MLISNLGPIRKLVATLKLGLPDRFSAEFTDRLLQILCKLSERVACSMLCLALA